LLAFSEMELKGNWWARFGWSSEVAMAGDWQTWYAARAHPARMPLMILAGPPDEPPRK